MQAGITREGLLYGVGFVFAFSLILPSNLTARLSIFVTFVSGNSHPYPFPQPTLVVFHSEQKKTLPEHQTRIKGASRLWL